MLKAYHLLDKVYISSFHVKAYQMKSTKQCAFICQTKQIALAFDETLYFIV